MTGGGGGIVVGFGIIVVGPGGALISGMGVIGVVGAGVMAPGVVDVLPGRGACVMPPGIGVVGCAPELGGPLALEPAAPLIPDGGVTLGVSGPALLGVPPAQPDTYSASTVQTWRYDHSDMANLPRCDYTRLTTGGRRWTHSRGRG